MKKKLLRIFFAFIMFFSVLPTAHIYNKEDTIVEASSESVAAYNIWVLNQKGFAWSNDATGDYTSGRKPRLVVSSLTFNTGYDINDLINWCNNYKDDIVEGYYVPDSSKCNYTINSSDSSSITLTQNTQVWGGL